MSTGGLVTTLLMVNAMFDPGTMAMAGFIPMEQTKVDFSQFSGNNDNKSNDRRHHQDPFSGGRSPKHQSRGNYRQNYGHHRYDPRSRDQHLYRHR